VNKILNLEIIYSKPIKTFYNLCPLSW